MSITLCCLKVLAIFEKAVRLGKQDLISLSGCLRENRLRAYYLMLDIAGTNLGITESDVKFSFLKIDSPHVTILISNN